MKNENAKKASSRELQRKKKRVPAVVMSNLRKSLKMRPPKKRLTKGVKKTTILAAVSD
jgi:hypothetical protein